MKKRSKSVRATRPRARRVKIPPQNNLRVVFSEKQIHKRVREIAEMMNRDYRGRTLHVVGILENCFLFMADLVRALKMPVVCHFLKAQMRDSASSGVPVREIFYTPKVDAVGKDVVLVDGILQSGVTLDHLFRYILGQRPASVRTATLIEKVDERKVDVATDYVGFRTTGKYLVGYGLGYKETFRNLPFVAHLAQGG